MFSGETAGQEAISLLSDSPLVQYEPGQEPGDLKHEDAGQTYGGEHTERPKSRNVLKTICSKTENNGTGNLQEYFNQNTKKVLLTVKYPTPKARMSVTLVTVIDTPACLIVSEMI